MPPKLSTGGLAGIIVFVCAAIILAVVAAIVVTSRDRNIDVGDGLGVTVVARRKLAGGVVFHRSIILGTKNPLGDGETFVLRHVQGEPGTDINVKTEVFTSFKEALKFAIAGQTWFIERHAPSEKTQEQFTAYSDLYVKRFPRYAVFSNNCLTYVNAMYNYLSVIPLPVSFSYTPEILQWANQKGVQLPSHGFSSLEEYMVWATANNITDHPLELLGFFPDKPFLN